MKKKVDFDLMEFARDLIKNEPSHYARALVLERCLKHLLSTQNIIDKLRKKK